MEFSQINSFSVCSCFRWHVYLQLDIGLIGSIISFPNSIWPGIFCLFWCYVLHIKKSASARMPIHSSASSTYFSCRLYLRTRFPNNLCILSMVLFACGFPGETDLVLISYSCYIKILLNSWPSIYPPWSYAISAGHGYRTSHIVSTKFLIVIAFLLLYFYFEPPGYGVYHCNIF